MQDPADPSALALMPDTVMVSVAITTAEKYFLKGLMFFLAEE
jgi:hypothetical protein